MTKIPLALTEEVQLSYIDNHRESAQPPLVLLHGIFDNKSTWFRLASRLAEYRLIAPDLVGMGDSDPLPDSGPDRYTFDEHRRYFDGALEALGVDQRVILVMHDWGSALGFDWANRHRHAIKGLCYMEALVRPVSWSEWPEASAKVFQGFPSPAGEQMVLDKNIFVEKVLPGSILRSLSDEEMAIYRRPYLEAGESRRPTLS